MFQWFKTALRRAFGVFLIGLGVVLLYNTWVLWRTTLDGSGWIEKGHFSFLLLAAMSILGGLLLARKQPPEW